MASILQNNVVADMFAGNLSSAHTYRMMLTTSAYTPDKDHDKRNDVTNEVTGTGYTAGGNVVTVSVTADPTNDRTILSIGVGTWPTSTITARYGAVYRARGGASSADELVAVLDFGGNIVSTGGTFATSETTPFYINH